MQTYASDILYHLVGSRGPDDQDANLATLIKILDSMEVRSNTIDGRSGGILIKTDPTRPLTNGEPIEQTVTCFCDLPLQSLGLHVAKYGQFGVGVDRAIVASWGARPVIYLPQTPRSPGSMVNVFAQDVKQVLSDLNRYFPGPEGVTTRHKVAGAPSESPQEAIDEAESLIQRDFLAFLKLFDVDLPDDHPENYYMEREWRKFGHLNLRMTLRHIVAPVMSYELLRNRFPSLAAVPILDATLGAGPQRDEDMLAVDRQNRRANRLPYFPEGV